MATDVLYILGTGSTWADAELRYSLRSLERFGTGVGRVFLTGADPGFLADAIVNERPDLGSPAQNHVAKVLWTIDHTDISEDFLLCYDDVFFLEPFSVEGYPYYADGALLPERANSTKVYKNALANAENILRANGKTTKRFGVHCPVIYNRTLFATLRAAVWDLAARMQHGVAVRSVYCNWWDVPTVHLSDCKIRTLGSRKELEDRIKGRPCFSIDDSAIAHGVAAWLIEQYPTRSRWEAFD